MRKWRRKTRPAPGKRMAGVLLGPSPRMLPPCAPLWKLWPGGLGASGVLIRQSLARRREAPRASWLVGRWPGSRPFSADSSPPPGSSGEPKGRRDPTRPLKPGVSADSEPLLVAAATRSRDLPPYSGRNLREPVGGTGNYSYSANLTSFDWLRFFCRELDTDTDLRRKFSRLEWSGLLTHVSLRLSPNEIGFRFSSRSQFVQEAKIPPFTALNPRDTSSPSLHLSPSVWRFMGAN